MQARRYTPPKQVRHPTDRQFAFGYSPPRLATTQLPSATELWLTPAGTFTLQIVRTHGRTLNRHAGSLVFTGLWGGEFRGVFGMGLNPSFLDTTLVLVIIVVTMSGACATILRVLEES